MPASNPKEAKLDGDANKSVSLDVSATQSALEDVDKCQNELESLNEKASEEILAVEQKYNELRRPHYDKRSKVIDDIPDFWYNAIINHPQIASMLSRDEQECLRSLTSVNVEEFADIKSGYKITFSFKENNYFANSTLVKEFHLLGNSESKSTRIEWKDGKDLTILKPQSKARKRHLGAHSSFFKWFMNNGDPNLDEIAETIKDDMWVNPLQYYLASEIEVGAENGMSDDDDDDDGDLDESVVVIGDDDSEDDDDDDDDDDGEEPEIFDVDDEDDDEDNDDDVQEVKSDDEEAGV